MRKFSLILLLVGFVMSACSVNRPQESSKTEVTPGREEVKVIVEDLPTFQGGDIKDFEAWVQDHVTYPESAAENGVEGTVYIMFQVEPDGSLSNINIMRGVDPVLDNEAVQVVKSAPNWEYQNRKSEQVNPRFRVAIEFKKE